MRPLQPREKWFLWVGALVVALFSGNWLVQTFVLQRMHLLDRQISTRQSEIARMQDLMQRHQALRSRLNALEQRLSAQQGSFLLALEDVVSQTQLRQHLESTQTQREEEIEGILVSIVELKFSKIGFFQIFELLKKLSFGVLVVEIQRVGIERRYENPHTLDLTLVLALYRNKQ